MSQLVFILSCQVSPHLAVSLEGRPVSDDEIVAGVTAELGEFDRRLEGWAEHGRGKDREERRGLALVETAGGAASPAPSGELQVHLVCCSPSMGFLPQGWAHSTITPYLECGHHKPHVKILSMEWWWTRIRGCVRIGVDNGFRGPCHL